MPARAFVPSELRTRPFTIAEARRAGLSERQLQGASWRRLSNGVYAWAHLADTSLLQLMALRQRLPAGAAFSDRTAGWIHGLDLPACDPVEAVVPPECGVSARSGIYVRRAPLPREDVVERKSLPVTAPLRTVTDLGRRLPLIDAVTAIDMALHDRLVDLDELRIAAADCGAIPGSARLRRAIDLAEPKTESPMETRLRLLLILAGLPRPCAQVSLLDERGRFLGRPDLLYRDQCLVIEYDGGVHRETLVNDDRRQNRLLGAGYRVLRFTAPDVLGNPDAVVAQVRAALGSRAIAGNPTPRQQMRHLIAGNHT
jgi:hypothetical protein